MHPSAPLESVLGLVQDGIYYESCDRIVVARFDVERFENDPARARAAAIEFSESICRDFEAYSARVSEEREGSSSVIFSTHGADPGDSPDTHSKLLTQCSGPLFLGDLTRDIVIVEPTDPDEKLRFNRDWDQDSGGGIPPSGNPARPTGGPRSGGFAPKGPEGDSGPSAPDETEAHGKPPPTKPTPPTDWDSERGNPAGKVRYTPSDDGIRSLL